MNDIEDKYNIEFLKITIISKLSEFSYDLITMTLLDDFLKEGINPYNINKNQIISNVLYEKINQFLIKKYNFNIDSVFDLSDYHKNR